MRHVNRTKTILNSLLVLAVMILIGTAGLTAYSFISLRDNMASVTTPYDRVDYKYHFMVILDGDDTDYVDQFIEGTERAAEALEASIEYWEFSGPDKEESIAKQFDTGVFSEVDGIVVDAYNTSFFVEILKRANANHIPVITLNENIIDIEKASHIDMNQYKIGSELGDVINAKGLKSGKIIVLEREDQFLEDQVIGLFDHLEGRYEIIIESIEIDEGDIINSEGITRQIIAKYDDISAIICTDSQNTIGVVQGVKNASAVGDIQVIGFGFNSSIIDYIKKDVIYATVVAKYNDVGFTAIESLVRHLELEFVSAYQNVPIVVATKETIDQYIEEVGIIDEEQSQED